MTAKAKLYTDEILFINIWEDTIYGRVIIKIAAKDSLPGIKGELYAEENRNTIYGRVIIKIAAKHSLPGIKK